MSPRRALPFLVLCLGCTFYRPPEKLSKLKENEILLVGKIEINPPVRPEEQKPLYHTLQGIVSYFIDDNLHTVDTNFTLRGTLNRTESGLSMPLEQVFFVSVPAKSFYLLDGFIYMKMRGDSSNLPSVEYAHLPGGLKIEVEPGDHAVYIGTLQYTRDEFFEIINTQLKDDYEEAQTEFKTRYGSEFELRKSLAKATQP